MTLRVLHIFHPNYRRRFSGPVFQWKYHFSHWSDGSIVHKVLDTETSKIIDSTKVFNFSYSEKQELANRWERIIWIFSLFKNLIAYKKEYDVMHVHVLWWGGLLIGLWSKFSKIPAIYESVLFEGDTPTGITKQQFGKLKLSLLKQYSSILAISEYLAEDFLKTGFSEEQVFTLMNSVNTKLFTPCSSEEDKSLLRQKMGIPNDQVVILFVGSLISRKGIDILINAFCELVRVKQNYFLIMVGPKSLTENPSIDEHFVEDQEKFLQKFGCEKKYLFTGLIQDRDWLAEIYQLADIFAFPSRNEGLPGVLLEAMASGLPVIVSDLPVLQQVVRDGENGLYVPVNDSEKLARAIIRVAEDPQLAAELGHNARATVEKHHSFEAWQANLTAYYYSLINEK